MVIRQHSLFTLPQSQVKDHDSRLRFDISISYTDGVISSAFVFVSYFALQIDPPTHVLENSVQLNRSPSNQLPSGLSSQSEHSHFQLLDANATRNVQGPSSCLATIHTWLCYVLPHVSIPNNKDSIWILALEKSSCVFRTEDVSCN